MKALKRPSATLLGPCWEALYPLRRYASSSAQVPPATEDILRYVSLLREFRARGHLLARLDPLGRGDGPFMGEVASIAAAQAAGGRGLAKGVVGPDSERRRSQTPGFVSPSGSPGYGAAGPLDLPFLVQNYPWQASRLDREAFLRDALGLRSRSGGPAAAALSALPILEGGRLPPLTAPGGVSELFEALHKFYCGPLAWDFNHVTTEEERQWWVGRAERPYQLARAEKRWLLRALIRTEALEDFLASRFPASKRFGLEGCEALIPGVEGLVRRAAEHRVSRIEMGMAHRGRINFLCNVLGKPFGEVVSQMKGEHNEFHVGDVVYHGRYENQRYNFLPFAYSDAHWGHSLPHEASPAERHVYLSLAPNPSHLEAVNPVVLGMVRAQQAIIQAETSAAAAAAATVSGAGTGTAGQGPGPRGHHVHQHEQQRDIPKGGSGLGPGFGKSGGPGPGSVMAVLFHGDAAFPGQGVVAETLNLSRLQGYDVGGSIHVIINNQVGFTTDPNDGRSTPHPTDVVRGFGVPVIHVNADHPEDVLRAFRSAIDYKAKFGRDVVVDLVGYRRNGHNELDNARATHPVTSAAIEKHPRVSQLYAARLAAEGVVSDTEAEAWRTAVLNELQAGYEEAKQGKFQVNAASFIGSTWQGAALASLSADSAGRMATWQNPVQEPTGLPLPTLQWVGRQLSRLPQGITPDAPVLKTIEDRAASLADEDSRVDWATAEALALGTLALHQGFVPPGVPLEAYAGLDPTSGLNRGHYYVRLSGQDSQRGTFAQRHAVLHDSKTGAAICPLNQMVPGKQEPVEIISSPLSEYATLGYEYGFSLGMKKRGLVLWEAQFGDFANGAQIIVDQFIASGETKWGQESGIVLLLPHGYDGQGPDHSSARIERFLQLVADDPDHLPGQSPQERAFIRRTFEALASSAGPKGAELRFEDVARVIEELGVEGAAAAAASGNWNGSANGSGSGKGGGGGNGNGKKRETVEVLWNELGLELDAPVTLATWHAFMVAYLRRNAERLTNLFVCNPTTPAQYFHLLRRQVNLPYSKPLVLIASKKLLHHRPCTSALEDFGKGNFFNRVIDDGKESDNTRHLAVNPSTGQPYLLPAEQIQRVLLCTGQVYYQLSQMRRTRRVRDMVLVRLEQIAPFPHDLVINVLNRYPNAEVAWVQEEPKNMGAWRYVSPRLATALKADALARLAAEGGPGPAQPREVRYVGRPTSAATATASMGIHLKEVRELLEAAFAPTLPPL